MPCLRLKRQFTQNAKSPKGSADMQHSTSWMHSGQTPSEQVAGDATAKDNTRAMNWLTAAAENERTGKPRTAQICREYAAAALRAQSMGGDLARMAEVV